jgi:CRP/FNR family transcriptional regulator
MDKTAPASICSECAARHQGICGALTPNELERLKRIAHRHKVQPGEPLAEPGDSASTFSVILSGAVKLMKLMPDGRQQIVGLQYAPDFLGRPFLNESDVLAEAVTETKVCTFSRGAIERMIAEAPGLEHRLYLQAMAELEDARELLLTLGRRTARERVATFLLFVVRQARRNEPEDAPKDAVLSLLLTRAEIADFLGLTIETVSRQLNQLQSLGIIEIEHNRSIKVLDEARLHHQAGEADDSDGTGAKGASETPRSGAEEQPSASPGAAP